MDLLVPVPPPWRCWVEDQHDGTEMPSPKSLDDGVVESRVTTRDRVHRKWIQHVRLVLGEQREEWVFCEHRAVRLCEKSNRPVDGIRRPLTLVDQSRPQRAQCGYPN